tara:strand:- start:6483 stop:6836 length:354 start_codon:yes stop_codon:yes gene_type:complete
MKRIIFFITLILGLTSCDLSSISLVKDGLLDSCEFSVGEMVDSYFSNPKWEEIVAEDNRTYVNVTGGITYDDKPAEVKLQFKIREDRFMVNALEINGEGQVDFVILGLLELMCQEAF